MGMGLSPKFFRPPLSDFSGSAPDLYCLRSNLYVQCMLTPFPSFLTKKSLRNAKPAGRLVANERSEVFVTTHFTNCAKMPCFTFSDRFNQVSVIACSERLTPSALT